MEPPGALLNHPANSTFMSSRRTENSINRRIGFWTPSHRNLLHLVLATTSALCLMCTPLSAQESTELRLEEVLVLGSHLNVNPVRISEFDITNDTSHQSLSHLINKLPGVAVTDSGNRTGLSQVRVRGAEADHVKIALDGFALNTSAFSLSLGSISPLNITNAELISGPQTTLFDGNALAGVINLSNELETATNTVAGFGSRNTRWIKHNVVKSSDGWLSSLGASYDRGDGWNVAPVGEEKDGYQQRSGAFRLQSRDSKRPLKFILSSTTSHSQYDPFPRDGDRETMTDLHLVGINWTTHHTDTRRIQIQAHQTLTGLRNYSEGSETNSWQGRTSRIGNVVKHTVNEQHEIGLGFDYSHETFSQVGDVTPWGDPNYREDLQALEALVEHLWTPANWEVNWSIRRDHNDNFQDATAWHLSIGQVINSWVITYSLGSNLKNPSFIERFGYTPDQFFGNPDLQPERSRMHEVDFTHNGPKQRIKVATFLAELADEINGFSFNTEHGLFSAINLPGERCRKGVEVSYDRAFTDLALAINYSFIDTSFVNEEPLLRRPQHLAYAEVRYTNGSRWDFTTRWNYTGSQFDRDFSVFPSRLKKLDAFGLVSFQTSYQSNEGLFTLTFENLLDTEYQHVYGYRQTGRSIVFSVKLEQ